MRDIIRDILNEVELINPREKSGKAKTYTQRKQKYQKGIGYKPKKSRQVTKKGVGRRNTSKTADARRILAKKHGIKRAEEKLDNKFVMDYTKIGELMDKYGYKYDRDVADWVNKKTGLDPDKRKRKKKKYSEPVKKEVKKKVVFVSDEKKKKEDDTDTALPPEVAVNDNVAPEFDFEQVTLGDYDYGQVTEDGLMNYIGRLLLLLNHDEEKAVEFVSDEAEEEFNGKVPMISSEAVIEDITEKGYIWDREKQTWTSSSGEFPSDFAKDETNRSVLGRAFATAFNSDYSYITLTGDGEFSTSRNRVYEDLDKAGFGWDSQNETWEKTEEE